MPLCRERPSCTITTAAAATAIAAAAARLAARAALAARAFGRVQTVALAAGCRRRSEDRIPFRGAGRGNVGGAC